MSSNAITLNQYQQLMRRFCHASAYNAVHAVAISVEEDTQLKLLNSINAVINQLALGNPEFSSDNQNVTYIPSTEPVSLISRCIALDEHIEEEMNSLFANTEFPLRFFIISNQSQHFFSITYNHWIADGYALRRLVEAIFSHKKEQTVPELSLNAPSIEDCFKHIYQKRTFYYRYLGVVQSFFRFSRALRTDANNDECTDTGCYTHFFEREVFQQLADFCKVHNVTLNDLFMAILAQLFGRITQEKRTKIKSKFLKPRRDRLVIGVIADIRGSSQLSLREIFGLFLGFFYVSFKSPEKDSLPALAQRIGSQTKRMKSNFTAVKQFLLFKVQTSMWDNRKDKRRQYRLFSKNTPITVGISNMNLNKNEGVLWSAVHQYIRFSPTAMVCPIVFNLTTFNNYLSLGINFRKACYSPSEVEKIKNAFVSDILALAKTDAVAA
ncbi:MAG: hypothetical protein A3F46_08535 [Legionellales bacterium RIFCSPHIGHO2_12_FULL_42_9]|nr:MAG: hypothetical protein A3F46_08535 [Legionellales bacterium RIFCSPHIGHO2_12_FULL_42_9]